ncbi:MAG: magnesium transporter, partial [Bdellovibrionales bacterium]|nr:magnesium transporter [Bdellovibrionales bacterium]
IFGELDTAEQITVFNLIPELDMRAELVSHLSESTQKDFIPRVPEKSVFETVALMDADDQTDLISRLPEELSKKILESMGKEDKEEIEDLLQYSADTAGGLMTTEILAFEQGLTVKRAIELLQQEAEEAVATFYAYVVDDFHKLVGVLSLKQLLLSKPTDILKDIMIKDTVSVDLETAQEDVAKLVEKYDFLSIPVVDENNTLMGAITVDDVIDVIREEAKERLLALGQTGSAADFSFRQQIKSRYPWISLSFIGGILGYLVLSSLFSFQETHGAWLIVSALPLLLMTGMTVSNQSTTVSVQAIREGKLDVVGLPYYLLNEIQIGTFFGLVLALLLGFMEVMFNQIPLPLAASLAVIVFIQVWLAVVLGVLVPWVLKRMQLDPAVGSLSVAAISSQLITVVVASSVIEWGMN